METKELTPEYVLQPHAISRAVYRLSATARKIIAMGMSILPPNMSNLTAVFNFSEFCRALGLERSSDRYTLIQNAILECVQTPITIETPEKWQTFMWIQTAEIDKKTNMISISFSCGLAEYLVTLKKMYARLELIDLGKLQSLYAIRLFELAKSYESLAGKQGNPQDCWYFERTVEEMRKILGIEDQKYTKTADFRRYVIEGPLRELNEADLGVAIVPEYVRKGKFLAAIRFSCRKNVRKAVGRKKKNIKDLPAPETDLRYAQELEAKEDEHLKKLYPDEFARLYAEAVENVPLVGRHTSLGAKAAEYQAMKRLKERRGTVQ
jgi:hypothetical protein